MNIRDDLDTARRRVLDPDREWFTPDAPAPVLDQANVRDAVDRALGRTRGELAYGMPVVTDPTMAPGYGLLMPGVLERVRVAEDQRLLELFRAQYGADPWASR